MNILKTPLLLLLAIFSIGLSSCLKSESTIEPFDAEAQALIDDELIQDYLTTNNIDATKDESGIYYNILVEGDSTYPTLDSEVEVYYKGYYLDEIIFDQTDDESISFPLNRVIEGWQIGIPLISKGGKGQLFIPSNLGYGPYDYYSIPGKSVLIFDVELVDFQ